MGTLGARMLWGVIIFETIAAGTSDPKEIHLPSYLGQLGMVSLSIKIAQRPYIIGSLGPKALKYESFEGMV